MKIFDIESPLMQFLGKVADLMIINILAFICSLPVITAGPALTAAHYVCLKMVRKEDSYIVRSYFKSFKENFKQATIIWLIILAIILILVGDYLIITKSDFEFHKIFTILLIVMSVIVGMITLMIFPLLAKFDNTIFAMFKNAFFMGLLQLPKVFLMAVLHVAPIVVFAFAEKLAPVVFMFGISVPVFVSALLYNKAFLKLENDIIEAQGGSEEVVEDDPDRIFSDKLDESLISEEVDNFRM